MNRRSKRVKRKVSARKPVLVAWRRWIVQDQQEIWFDRLRATGCHSWAVTERPGRPRILLEAYVDSRADATALVRNWGGRIHSVDPRQWLKAQLPPPTRIGSRLEVIHEKARAIKKAARLQLHIPHGIAFGSGDHATTSMLLRALASRTDSSQAKVLDLGTGSGVLALAARLFGANKIVAIDFDPDSVRTSRENEALNFTRPLIRWRKADVKKLRPTTKYDLVLANLFSGILCEAAPQIAACVSPGGELWLSGILASQQEEVTSVYRGQGMRLARAVRRGKWVMLQWTR
jgi:ribosomal protein L11 methyltransferase